MVVDGTRVDGLRLDGRFVTGVVKEVDLTCDGGRAILGVEFGEGVVGVSEI